MEKLKENYKLRKIYKNKNFKINAKEEKKIKIN
jgi:hypothetical protein